jgi:CPA2 family monovalent cation:H+ antiporter-2
VWRKVEPIMLDQIVFLVTLIFGVAIGVIAICTKLNVPPVIGFILTGLALGPFATSMGPSENQLKSISEFGVLFLMFMVGLDFTPTRLKKLGRLMFVGGSIQAVLTVAVLSIIALFGLVPFASAILIAFVVIQSSTAIALKVYHERGEANAPHTDLSIGYSLFQDVSTVLLLLLIPFLGDSQNMGITSMIGSGRNIVMLVAIFIAGYFLLPYLLKFIIGTGIRELVVLTALVVCLGFSGISQKLGFSLALGSFVAGIILSRGEYHTQFMAEIVPFKDVFLSLFFISIGMEHNWGFAINHFGYIVLLMIGVIIIKTLIFLVPSAVLKINFRTSIITAVSLSNIGEFGFVILLAAAPYGLLSKSEYQTLSCVAIYSMLITPFLINFISNITLKMGEISNGEDKKPPFGDAQVIIVGYGLAGRHLAQVLKTVSVRYTVIECNGQIANDAISKGEPVLFGDASRRDVLEYSGIKKAQMIVFLISDPSALKTSIKLTQLLNRTIGIICRTRRMNEIEQILKLGAEQVVSEEFETSIELFTIVLDKLHVPRNVIRAQTKVLREDGYEMLRVPAQVRGVSDKLVQALASGTTDVFQVMSGHYAEGKALNNIALRSHTGVTVIAIVRNDKSITNPPPEFQLEQGDALIIMGSHAQIEAAFSYLELGSRSDGEK